MIEAGHLALQAGLPLTVPPMVMIYEYHRSGIDILPGLTGHTACNEAGDSYGAKARH
ncbi:MAG: hypothetical protein M0Z68_12515 [Gammaproteobacteria bacterium]|nr:hypothetical protein [Gammaproteobacteria bacterium]